MVIDACRHGKDVFCQKPETRTIEEGPLMVDAVHRYGRIFSGEQAWELGLVDELGDMDRAFERAKSLAGLPDAKLIAYEQPFSFSSLFRIQSALPSDSQIKLDLGLDIPGLEAGRLYFISSTYVQ